MLIKRLEITGFKSFPNKTVIDFPPGVSAIVGPNGCGKSNIIDAIKWVMGEQSIKQLRGKSMGDVIFSGTEKRPALNMAEVAMVLSNDTPADNDNLVSQLTEIMITRRLFRSGESAYLINKQPCRLKDIHNIFMGSGMGARSCAIVQQGNIGAITDAAPEDRRIFIEEAAGVTRYKTRKNEAISKVSATRQNLLRLEDIVEEIRKQMTSLRRQARKAQRYKDFRQGLKQSDMLVSTYYHEQFTARITETQALLSELKAKDAAQARELAALNAALDKISAERSEKNQKISHKKMEKSEAEKQIETCKNDLKYLKTEEKRLSEEITGLNAAVGDLFAKSEKIKDEIAEETAKIKTLNARTEENKIALDKQVALTSGIRSQLAEQQKMLDSRKKQLMQVMAQKAKFQNIFQNAAAGKDQLQQQLQRLEKEETTLDEQIKKLQLAISETEKALETLESARENVLQRISEAKLQLDHQSSALGKQIKTVNELQNQRHKIHSEHLALKKMADNYEWYRDGVKAVMRDLGTGSPTHRPNHPEPEHRETNPPATRDLKIMGIAADALEPEPGYELALEAALGEALQYIIVSDRLQAVQAIQYLKKNNTGRSGFLPLPEKETAAAGPVFAEALPRQDSDGEALPRLINHVKITAPHGAMLADLLKDIAVAADFEAALAATDTENKFSKIVTREGDMITAAGVLVGGSEEKLSGIYKKKMELNALKRQLAGLDQALETARHQQINLETAVKQLETDLQQRTVRKNEIEKKITETEKQHFQTSEILKNTRTHYRVLALEKEKLQGEKTDMEAEIAAHDAALAEIRAEETAAEADVADLTDQLAELNDQLTSVGQAEMELKLTRTRLETELENAEKTLGRLKEYQSDGHRQAEQVKNDIIVKTRKKTDTAQKISQTEKSLSRLTASLDAIVQELRDQDDTYQQIVAEIATTDTTIQSTRTLREEIQEKVHTLELELSGLNIKRENIVNRFLERYSRSFSDCLEEHRESVLADDFSIEKTEAALAACRRKIDRIGDVNLGAIDAYEAQKKRYEFLVQQREDLVKAMDDLESVIKKINRITQTLFMEMFEKINTQFKAIFPRLFSGGSAWLELTQPNTPLETGVELMIHPPGKKVTRLSLLSGGEKALSAIAFIFSIFLINPAAYCLLDEIDAPLDEANTHRFNELLKIIGEKSQIIMISHNKRSMEFSDRLFGVTMNESGVSKLVSVDLEKLAAARDSQPAP